MDELNTEGELPDVLMNEMGADGDKADQHFDGHATENFTVANEIEAMEVFKQIVRDQWSGSVTEMVADFNRAVL